MTIFRNSMPVVSAVIAVTLSLAGCSSDKGGTGDDEDSSDGGTDSGASTTGPGNTTSGTSAGTTVADTSGPLPTTSSTITDTGADSSSGPPVPQPNGSECSSNEECESEMCYQLSILGGFCGDCLSDADCPDGGCTLPNPLSDPPGGATCNMGELGGGCEARSTDVCQEGLTCELLLDVPDLFQINTCSECSADADCGELLCSPSVDLLAFSGQKTCVSPGDVVDGQACDHEGSGDEACASGICAAYNVMGLVTIGVCGECEIDGDCPNPGDVCNDPSVDLETGVITPTFCSAPE